MAATILAVSEDEAFATMLQEGLEGLGQYAIIVAHDGRDARRIAGLQQVDLLIVDADLERCAPAQLVADIRAERPDTRLIWMPFLGQELPAELARVDSQGLLSKPFYIEDLRHQVELALGGTDDVEPPPRPAAERKEPAVTAPPRDDTASVRTATAAGGHRRIVLGSDRPSLVGSAGAGDPKPALWFPDRGVPSRFSRTLPELPAEAGDGPLGARLTALARDLNAEGALLADRDGRILAWTGIIHQRYAPGLAAAVAAEIAAADRIAGLLHERSGRFVTHIHEGRDFLLFSMFLWECNFILSVAVRADVPLGTLRYQVRQAATELSRYVRK